MASSSNGAPTFLNLGRDYPDMHRFTVVIWGRNRSRFGAPENRYRGRTICVRGLISTYAGVPQIEDEEPSHRAARETRFVEKIASGAVVVEGRAKHLRASCHRSDDHVCSAAVKLFETDRAARRTGHTRKPGRQTAGYRPPRGGD